MKRTVAEAQALNLAQTEPEKDPFISLTVPFLGKSVMIWLLNEENIAG